MARVQDLLELELSPVALGVGMLILAPILLPAAGHILRPLAKGMIKTGIATYRAALEEAPGELVEEAASEVESEAAESLVEALAV